MPDLFDLPTSRSTDPPTSHAAAQDAAFNATRGRLLALGQLSRGAKTDFELAAATGLQQTSIGKRRHECREHGLVRECRDGRGEVIKRPAPSGSMAIVWEITPSGAVFYQKHLHE